MTFAPRKVPSPEEPVEFYARGDKAYRCLLPTWPVRKGPPGSTDWLTPAEEGEAFPAKDLECPLPLEPFMWELLEDKEASCNDIGMDSGMLPPSPLMLGEHEPSPIEHEHWIKWHTQYIDMPAWWHEWEAVSNLDEFTQQVRTFFEVPKAQCQALGVENNHLTPPAPKHLRKDWFLPLLDPWMGSQDYQMLQPKMTLVYVRALQYWAEEAQLPIPG